MKLLTLPTLYLAAVGFIDHKDFTPGLDSCGLSLTASSPREPYQGLVITSYPRLTLLQTVGGKVRGIEKCEGFAQLHQTNNVDQTVV